MELVEKQNTLVEKKNIYLKDSLKIIKQKDLEELYSVLVIIVKENGQKIIIKMNKENRSNQMDKFMKVNRQMILILIELFIAMHFNYY